MGPQSEHSQHAIRCAADEKFHGNFIRSVLFVFIEAARSRRESVKKRPQMCPAGRIHEVQPHRRRIRMLAVLCCGIVGREKSRACHGQMKYDEHDQSNPQSRSRSHRPDASARIRGSTQYSSKSARKLPATKKSVDSNTPPITTYKSLAKIASSRNGPSPGQLITTSTNSDPLSSVPRLNPKSAINGCPAAGSTYRKSSRRREIPCPSAARKNGASNASATAERTCRSKTGKADTTSTVTGSTRCTATSRIFCAGENPSNPTDTMPPVGSHPLRTARSSKPSASVRSGTINSAAVAQLNTASAGRPSRSALHTPSGSASSHTKMVAVPVSSSVLRARVQTSGATGVLYANENPRSPCSSRPAQCA